MPGPPSPARIGARPGTRESRPCPAAGVASAGTRLACYGRRVPVKFGTGGQMFSIPSYPAVPGS